MWNYGIRFSGMSLPAVFGMASPAWACAPPSDLVVISPTGNGSLLIRNKVRQNIPTKICGISQNDTKVVRSSRRANRKPPAPADEIKLRSSLMTLPDLSCACSLLFSNARAPLVSSFASKMGVLRLTTLLPPGPLIGPLVASREPFRPSTDTSCHYFSSSCY